ncbi:MAG: CPBP family intramembrane metalloprotease [Chitinophagaceae bacterium]|nr:CPBP family intramembrane metalloprotease [Chitinophagaceae bacterium]
MANQYYSLYIAPANLHQIILGMEYRSVKGFTCWGQLGILLVFLGAGFILAAITQLVIVMQILPAGVSMNKMSDEMMKVMLKPENVGYARLSQVVGTFFLLFIPAILYMLVCHGKNKFWLGFNKHINAAQIVLGFFLIFLANVVANPLAELSKSILTNFPSLNAMGMRLEDAYTEQVTALSNLKSWGEFFMAIIIMAFFPALFEEIFFRGALQNLLERWWKAPLLAVIVTSLIFSFIHMSVFLFLSRVVLGFVLGLMYQRSRNLWVNIIAHFLNNTVAVIQLFWLSKHQTKIEVDKLDPKIPLWGGLIALAITFGLFLLFEKVSAKNRKQIAFEEQDLIEHIDIGHSYPTNKN